MAGGSSGPVVWAVSDGRAGNAAQVRAVVQALMAPERRLRLSHIDSDADRKGEITLHPRAPWTRLPGARWPFALKSLPAAERKLFAGPFPAVWIAAGRRSAPFTRAIRKRSGGETFTVQILDPKAPPGDFDLVVTPEHDALNGENVINTVGSPAYFDEDRIEQAGLAFAHLADDKRSSAVVILGGDSKAHSFTAAAADRLIAQLEALAARKWRLRITASRRTPLDVATRMRAAADRMGADFWAGPRDGANPYLAWLLFSDAAIITEDSANMLSEAAWHGLPVHIARLEGRSDKFDRLHQSLIERGCARWFDGKLETWSYPPLREAERVADAIVEGLLHRYPPPAARPENSGNYVKLPDWLK